MNVTKWYGVEFADGEIIMNQRQHGLRRAIETRNRYGFRCPHRFFKSYGKTANEAFDKYLLERGLKYDKS